MNVMVAMGFLGAAAVLGVLAAIIIEVKNQKKKEDWLLTNKEASEHLLPRGTRVMLCGARVKNERVLGRVGTVLGGVSGGLSVMYKIDGEIIEEILPREKIISCVRVYSNEMLLKEIEGHAKGWYEEAYPEKCGHWKKDKAMYNDWPELLFCSECGEACAAAYDYCPHCGAKMDGEVTGDVR